MEFTNNQESDGENIWCAASDGDINRVTFLLNQNISVNAQDESGYSPMYVCSVVVRSIFRVFNMNLIVMQL